MKIEIRSSNVPLSQPLHDHTARRLGFALRTLAEHIDHVVVRLVDLNGPRGGLDKLCRMVVSLRSAGRLIVEATDADAYVAVSQAARRLEERAARRLRREARPLSSRRPSPRQQRSLQLATTVEPGSS